MMPTKVSEKKKLTPNTTHINKQKIIILNGKITALLEHQLRTPNNRSSKAFKYQTILQFMKIIFFRSKTLYRLFVCLLLLLLLLNRNLSRLNTDADLPLYLNCYKVAVCIFEYNEISRQTTRTNG